MPSKNRRTYSVKPRLMSKWGQIYRQTSARRLVFTLWLFSLKFELKWQTFSEEYHIGKGLKSAREDRSDSKPSSAQIAKDLFWTMTCRKNRPRTTRRPFAIGHIVPFTFKLHRSDRICTRFWRGYWFYQVSSVNGKKRPQGIISKPDLDY